LLSFNIGEIIEEAYERVGVDVQKLNAHHLRTARRSMNALFSFWASKNVRVWAIEQETQTLTAGDGNFTTPAGTIDVLEAVLRRSNTDTPMVRLARGDWLAIPNKTTQGRPDRFFVDKSTSALTVNLWQIPENSTDQMIYWRIRRQSDVTAYTETADVPYHWVDALMAGLAGRLYQKRESDGYDRSKYADLQSDAREKFDDAISEDRDRAPLSIIPEGYQQFA
jgi:hypothetical protein